MCGKTAGKQIEIQLREQVQVVRDEFRAGKCTREAYERILTDFSDLVLRGGEPKVDRFITDLAP